MRAILLTLILLATVLSAHANAVLEWTELTIEAIRLETSGPTLSSRNLAIIHTSMFDAVNSILRTHQPYQFQLDAPAECSLEAAVVGAAYESLHILYPAISARADTKLSEFRSANQSAAGIETGLEFGKQIARLTLASREADGANTDIPYIPSADPGQWRRTPPFFRPPTTPNWRYVTPFGISEVEPFVPGPPPALDSAEYAASLAQVRALGAKTNSTRTSEQSVIAQFWSDFSYTSMPPGHWHLIAATIARAKSTPLGETARLFALLSIAQADAAIVCWEAKYRYNLWRPVTAIQQADTDGNPLTEPDPAWDHFLAAPSFPSYTSGHSTFSNASAQTLTHFYGTDAITFAATSDALPGIFRTFTSLSACANEIGMSRIYGGIHYSFDNSAGQFSGGLIGDFICANWLLPNDTLPRVQIDRLTSESPTVRVHGHVGAVYSVEASDDLITWNQISIVTGAGGGVEIRDFNPTKEARFYRLLEKQ